jgi:succinoglycan biosynthesis transport protein ExoP
VIATALLGALVGLALGLMRPNSYTSTGTLLLRSGVRETATAESAVGGRETVDARPFDLLANEMEILSHRDAIRRVIDKVGVARILEVYDPAGEDTAETPVLSHWLHRLQTWWFASSTASLTSAPPERREVLATKTLTTNLSLRPGGSSLIRVSYEAQTPELAKEVTDAFLAAAEEHHRDVFSNRTSLEFLTTMERQARAAAKETTDALSEFKQQHGIYDLAIQRTAIIGDLEKLEAQAALDDEQLHAIQSRCESLRQMFAKEGPTDEVLTEAPPKDNPEYTALQQQIVTLKKEETTMRGTGLTKSELERRTRVFEELIAELQQSLADMPPMFPAATSRQTVKNARYERLRSLLDEDELKLVAARAAHDGQAARLAQLRKRLEEYEEVGPRYVALVGEVATREDNSRRLLESLQRSELLNLLDENKLSNLRVLEPGDLPAQKSGPNRALRTLIGSAFGCMLGLCIALLRHRFDGSVQRAQDLAAVGAEVLGVVPESRAVAAQEVREDAMLTDPGDGPLRHRLDSIWTAVLPATAARDSRCTIAIVGDEHAGATTVALHLAVRAATSFHLDVLLVETNHHHATLANRLGLDQVPGLMDLIGGTAAREEVVRPTRVPGLRIVHAGSSDAARRRTNAGQRTEDLLRSLADGCQIVLLDVSSIVEHPEFRRFALHADLVVPVFAAGRTTREGAQALLHAIGSAGKRTPGAILNRWRSIRPFWLPKDFDI